MPDVRRPRSLEHTPTQAEEMKLLVSCLSGAAALNFAVLALLLGARSGRAGTGARFENGTWCAGGILERAEGNLTSVGCCPKSCGARRGAAGAPGPGGGSPGAARRPGRLRTPSLERGFLLRRLPSLLRMQ